MRVNLTHVIARIATAGMLLLLTSCSNHEYDGLLAKIQAKLIDGDHRILLMRDPNVAATRDWDTLHQNYVALRNLYCEIANELEETKLPIDDLDPILDSIREWEDVIKRFRSMWQQLKATPLDHADVAFADPSKSIDVVEVQQRLIEFGPSKQEREEREQDWKASEARLDAAISAIRKLRQPR